jgi:predicted permease
MNFYFNLLQSLATVLIIILIFFLLRKRSILKEEHQPLFGKLVTNFVLPVFIFTGLYKQKFDFSALEGAFIFILIIILSLALSIIIGKLLKLEKKQLGSFILVSCFGSSATLGYSIISQVFPNNPHAVADAVLMNEIGVGVVIFTLGVIVANYFGRDEKVFTKSFLKSFITNPIILSIVLGISFSFFLPEPTGLVADTLMGVLVIIGNSLIIFVAISIALMIRPFPLRKLMLLIVFVVSIELVIQPLIAVFISHAVNLNQIDSEILLMETLVPPGTVAAVLADRYGCDGPLAANLVIATYIFSLITIPVILSLL